MTSPETPQRRRVVIVGAGLAGLSCAVELVARGIEPLVLEASDGVGGRVRTDLVDGFRLDRGFQVLLTAYPEARQLLDYRALRLRPFFPGALIRARGRFRRIADPWRAPIAGISTVLQRTIPAADALRIARFRRRVTRSVRDTASLASDRSTLARLSAEGFSTTAVERFFRPFFGGVFLDPELATSERQLEFVFRMFSAGDIAVPALGMGEIPRQLASHLPEGTIHTRHPVAAVDAGGAVLENGSRIDAAAVVVAADGSSAHKLVDLPGTPGWRGVSCLYFATDEPPSTGPVLVLNGDGSGPVNNLCVMSDVSNELSPGGTALVSATVLGTPGTAAEPLEGRVRQQMVEWFGASARTWRHLKSYVIDRALPVYETPEPGAGESKISDTLFICGDHRADPSINGAMSSGRRAAAAVVAELERGTR